MTDAPVLDERDATPRRRRTALWVAIVLGLVMVLFVGVLATRRSAADRPPDNPLQGRPAPGLSGTTLQGGQLVDADLRGRWLLVNFFASWCGPCHKEHPELLKFAQRHRATADATVVGVTFDDDPADARRFLASGGGDWPVRPDPDGHLGLLWGVRGPPESYLVDPRGVVVAKIVGPITADYVDNLLRQAKDAGL